MSQPTEQLNQLHLHELLDRAHCLQEMFDSLIVHHPAAHLAQEAIRKAEEALGAVYLAAGQIAAGDPGLRAPSTVQAAPDDSFANRNAVLDEAALAMRPMLRDMISRSEAARIILALKLRPRQVPAESSGSPDGGSASFRKPLSIQKW